MIDRLWRHIAFALDPAQASMPGREVIVALELQKRNGIPDDENVEGPLNHLLLIGVFQLNPQGIVPHQRLQNSHAVGGKE